MKIPFPYKIAAEFYLFCPPKKLTLIHILIILTSVIFAFFVFVIANKYFETSFSAIAASVTFFLFVAAQYHVSCRMFSLLLKASDKGWLASPDKELMQKQIEINLHRKLN